MSNELDGGVRRLQGFIFRRDSDWLRILIKGSDGVLLVFTVTVAGYVAAVRSFELVQGDHGGFELTCRELSNRNVQRVVFCILMTTLLGCTPAADEELPPFVTELIAQLEAGPKTDPPGSVWRYSYRGDVVFYVPPFCCDVPSTVYAVDGSIICGPDGGITGRGDGGCPDFFAARTQEKLVWTDKR